MITRRQVLLAIGAAGFGVAPLSRAQQSAKAYRVGTLAFGSAASVGRLYGFFTQGLRQLGYVEGKNIIFERRYADGDSDRLAALAIDLVQRKVDVIFSPTTVSVRAAMRATATIPVVFANVDDPVASGFVASLARPGGNVTGTAVIQQVFSAKRLQLLKEIQPKTSRVALVVSSEPQAAAQMAEIERAAKTLGLELFPISMREPRQTAQELVRIQGMRVDGLYVLSTAENYNNRKRIAEAAAAARLPAIFPSTDYLEYGGLVSYGIDTQFMFRYAARYVDKILKGARPADLPVEQPTRYELVVNIRAANALGITVPQSVLLRADRVID